MHPYQITAWAFSECRDRIQKKSQREIGNKLNKIKKSQRREAMNENKIERNKGTKGRKN